MLYQSPQGSRGGIHGQDHRDLSVSPSHGVRFRQVGFGARPGADRCRLDRGRPGHGGDGARGLRHRHGHARRRDPGEPHPAWGRAGGRHAWRIREGLCAEGDSEPDPIGSEVGVAGDYPALEPDDGGNASGTASLPLTLEKGSEYHVDVYETESADVVVACGDLRGNPEGQDRPDERMIAPVGRSVPGAGSTVTASI